MASPSFSISALDSAPAPVATPAASAASSTASARPPVWDKYDPKYFQKHSLYGVLYANPHMFPGRVEYDANGGGYDAGPNPEEYRQATGRNVTREDPEYQKWYVEKTLGGKSPGEFFDSTNTGPNFQYDPSDGQVLVYNGPGFDAEDTSWEKLMNTTAMAIMIAGTAGIGSAVAGAAGAAGGLSAGAVAAETAALTGSGVAVGGAAGTGATAGIGSFGDIIASQFTPEKIATNLVKQGVTSVVTGREPTVAGVAGGLLGGAAGGVTNAAVGGGVVGDVAGAAASYGVRESVGGMIGDTAPTRAPISAEAIRAATPAVAAPTGTGANDVPASFALSLSAFQPQFKRNT